MRALPWPSIWEGTVREQRVRENGRVGCPRSAWKADSPVFLDWFEVSCTLCPLPPRGGGGIGVQRVWENGASWLSKVEGRLACVPELSLGVQGTRRVRENGANWFPHRGKPDCLCSRMPPKLVAYYACSLPGRKRARCAAGLGKRCELASPRGGQVCLCS